jgi:hypothetical protein
MNMSEMVEGLQGMSRAEQRSVEAHRIAMAEAKRQHVSLEEALADWLEHHAQRWREERLARGLALQREEILRHKWIESEKAQRDLGATAALDWARNHAARWRQWFEEESDGSSVA